VATVRANQFSQSLALAGWTPCIRPGREPNWHKARIPDQIRARLHFVTPVPFRDNRMRQSTPRFGLWVSRAVHERVLAHSHLHLESSAFDSGSRHKHRCSVGNVVWHGSDYGHSARKNRNLAHDVQLWVAHRLPVTSLRVSTSRRVTRSESRHHTVSSCFYRWVLQSVANWVT
jgi:hypothetical protein